MDKKCSVKTLLCILFESNFNYTHARVYKHYYRRVSMINKKDARIIILCYISDFVTYVILRNIFFLSFYTCSIVFAQFN